VPTVEQTRSVTAELNARAKLPAHVEKLIRSFPKGMHPMTQVSMALLACQTES
jgi:citrate synthase